MTGTRRWLAFLPPLLAGVAAAVALETSAGLLLYLDDGFLPALTLLLTVEVGSFGLGLLSAPLPVGGGTIEQIRRRWLFCLVTYALAAALGAGLNLLAQLPGTAIGQGIGLGFLGALPLFSLGALLGAMSRPDDLGRRWSPLVGPPAVLGTALGFLLSGTVLLPSVAPHTLYLFCLVILSGGALLQGWILDGRVAVQLLETRGSNRGTLRVERRVLGSPRDELTLLMDGDALRGAEGPGGEPRRPWEAAVLEGLAPERVQPEGVLYLGGGSGTLIRRLSQGFPHARMRVVEGNRDLVELARSHFVPWDDWDEVELVLRDPLTLDQSGGFQASVTVVDCAVLPFVGGVVSLRDSDWRLLVDSLKEGGVAVLGGLWFVEGSPGRPHTNPVGLLMREARHRFPGVSLYRRDPPVDGRSVLQEWSGRTELLLLLSTAGSTPWPASLADFQLESQEGD